MNTAVVCGHEWRPLPPKDGGTSYGKAILPIVRYIRWNKEEGVVETGSFALPVIRGGLSDDDVTELQLRYPVTSEVVLPDNARRGVFWDRTSGAAAGTVIGHAVHIRMHEKVAGKHVGWQVVPYVAVWTGTGVQHARAAESGEGVLVREDLEKALYEWWYEAMRSYPIGEGMALVDHEGTACTGEPIPLEATA